MIRGKILLFILIISSIYSFSQDQNNWEIIDTKEYHIEYPNNWQLDTTGRMNTEFILFSKREEKDSFRENVNLSIQDLSNHLLNLASYTELSINQIKAIPNSKIIESGTLEKNNIKYHKVIWKGFVSNKNLKFKQIYFVKNNKAFLLTLTCEEKAFEKYEPIGTKILNSFIIK